MRFVLFLSAFASASFTGCWKPSAPPPGNISEPQVVVPGDPPATDPLAVLEQMVSAYQSATSYSDRATLQIVGKVSPLHSQPTPWNCLVALQKSNKLRLEICDGIFVSDGEDCFAQIRMIPQQVLHFPAPESWTLETLFQDVHLYSAMELPGLPLSVLCFPPQLVLLFANNPLNTFCPRGAKVEWLEQQPLDSVQCDVIRITHSDGSRILWISQVNSILLRLEYRPVGLPVPEGFESIEAIRIEMTDARFGWDFVPESFQMLQPSDAVKVDQFQSDIPGLPAQEEHRRRLKSMSESGCYRQIDQHVEASVPSEHVPPPKEVPRTFSLEQMWTRPLLGVGTMSLLPGAVPQLVVPCEGNRVAALNLQGKVLHIYSPQGLEESVIIYIRCNALSDKRRIGIITLDGKFHLFDENFQPVTVRVSEPGANPPDIIRDFVFFPFAKDESDAETLLLAVQRGSEHDDTPADCVIYAVGLQGTKISERLFKGAGVPRQILPAVMPHLPNAPVSCVAADNRILILPLEEEAEPPIEIPYGRHVIWFHVMGSTIYTLLETADTGDVRFAGLDESGKGKWSRLLPPGEYDVEPVFVPNEKKWLVPSSSGKIIVFDEIGNMIETFSLGIIPTGLLCAEADDAVLLIIADGETVSAWKIGSLNQKPLE